MYENFKPFPLPFLYQELPSQQPLVNKVSHLNALQAAPLPLLHPATTSDVKISVRV